jgi:hypothetical protein
LATCTDDFFVHWVVWGAILAMHFVETLFFEGGLFGGGKVLPLNFRLGR